jgi:uncharacterized membrane protein (UPF0127 family)
VTRLLALAAVLLGLAACGGGGGGGGFDPSLFASDTILVDDVEVAAWVADEPWQIEQGLMGATLLDLAPLLDGTPRGMLFAFPAEQTLSFWMRGTGVPLDLAYVRADGTVAEVHALVPWDETAVLSGEPCLWALECLAGTFEAEGIGVGSVLVP